MAAFRVSCGFLCFLGGVVVVPALLTAVQRDSFLKREPASQGFNTCRQDGLSALSHKQSSNGHEILATWMLRRLDQLDRTEHADGYPSRSPNPEPDKAQAVHDRVIAQVAISNVVVCSASSKHFQKGENILSATDVQPPTNKELRKSEFKNIQRNDVTVQVLLHMA
jgi:hypothetical protein